MSSQTYRSELYSLTINGEVVSSGDFESISVENNGGAKTAYVNQETVGVGIAGNIYQRRITINNIVIGSPLYKQIENKVELSLIQDVVEIANRFTPETFKKPFRIVFETITYQPIDYGTLINKEGTEEIGLCNVSIDVVYRKDLK